MRRPQDPRETWSCRTAIGVFNDAPGRKHCFIMQKPVNDAHMTINCDCQTRYWRGWSTYSRPRGKVKLKTGSHYRHLKCFRRFFPSSRSFPIVVASKHTRSIINDICAVSKQNSRVLYIWLGNEDSDVCVLMARLALVSHDLLDFFAFIEFERWFVCGVWTAYWDSVVAFTFIHWIKWT